MDVDDRQDDDIKESMSDVEDDKDNAKVSRRHPSTVNNPQTPFSAATLLISFSYARTSPALFSSCGGVTTAVRR